MKMKIHLEVEEFYHGVPRENVVAAFRELLDIDPAHVKAVHFYHRHIVAEVFVTDENGRLLAHNDGALTANVRIAITDEDDDR